LRARSCAMLTGVGTVLRDDPELTVRHVPCSRQPRRVVIDSRLDMPAAAKIMHGEPPLILTVSVYLVNPAALAANGSELRAVPPGSSPPSATSRNRGRKAMARGCASKRLVWAWTT